MKRGGPILVNSFYTYDGSLTTPGCTENVRWSVLADGGQVSNAAVTLLHQVIARFPGYAATRTTTGRCNPSTDGSSSFAAHHPSMIPIACRTARGHHA